jgi:hypothetical protein
MSFFHKLKTFFTIVFYSYTQTINMSSYSINTEFTAPKGARMSRRDANKGNFQEVNLWLKRREIRDGASHTTIQSLNDRKTRKIIREKARARDRKSKLLVNESFMLYGMEETNEVEQETSEVIEEPVTNIIIPINEAWENHINLLKQESGCWMLKSAREALVAQAEELKTARQALEARASDLDAARKALEAQMAHLEMIRYNNRAFYNMVY